MVSFVRVCFLTVVLLSDKFLVTGEMYQFYLDILDMMDPSWIYSTADSIETKIECASLCYRDKDSCSYFGYKGSTCYLLKDSVDRDICSQDDCFNSGMKVYKWKQEITTTEEPTTETSTTVSTTTPVKTTTTTPASTTTTTTGEVTTTSTETTVTTEDTTTTTTEATTTTTDAATTTTTEGFTTTTTTEGTTTTTEGTTTTTEGAEDTTTTTTEAPTTSTTATEAPTTTTTEATTTTTEVTSTTTEGWNCDPPEGLEGDVKCPADTFLLRAMGTRSKFLVDVFSGTCTDMQEQVYEDDEEVYTFFTLDGGITLESKCPNVHHVIYMFKLCVKNDHPAAITLHCRFLKDPDRIEDYYNVTNNDLDNLVDCGDHSALQSVSFGPHSFNEKLTMIRFLCLRVHVESIVPAAEAPEPGVG